VLTKADNFQDRIKEKSSETVEEFGGSRRDRTYGPLIKGERKGIPHVVADLGHPLVILADRQSRLLTLQLGSDSLLTELPLAHVVKTPDRGSCS
jgi:hypothetical protein